MRKYALYLLLGFSSSSIFANGARLYFSPGVFFLQTDKLNSSISKFGYKKFSSAFTLLGGGLLTLNDRLIIGGSGYSVLTQSTNRSTQQLTLSGSYGGLDIGYSVFQNDSTLIYPMLSLSGGKMELKFENDQNYTFEQVLTKPEKTALLSTGGFLLSFSVGIDHLLATTSSKQSIHGTVLGLKVGYLLGLYDKQPDLDRGKVTDAPDFTLNGIFISLYIGPGLNQRSNPIEKI